MRCIWKESNFLFKKTIFIANTQTRHKKAREKAISHRFLTQRFAEKMISIKLTHLAYCCFCMDRTLCNRVDLILHRVELFVNWMHSYRSSWKWNFMWLLFVVEDVAKKKLRIKIKIITHFVRAALNRVSAVVVSLWIVVHKHQPRKISILWKLLRKHWPKYKFVAANQHQSIPFLWYWK